MTESMRYPVGRFDRSEAFNPIESGLHIDEIRELPTVLRRMVAGLDDSQLDTPYRAGGWSVRQVVHHVADSHLNAYIRTKLALTEAAPPIRPYDEKGWAELADARSAPIVWSLDLLDGLHARWSTLLTTLDPAAWQRELIHPEWKTPLTVWGMTALYAWHGRHHVAHIAALRTRMAW